MQQVKNIGVAGSRIPSSLTVILPSREEVSLPTSCRPGCVAGGATAAGGGGLLGPRGGEVATERSEGGRGGGSPRNLGALKPRSGVTSPRFSVGTLHWGEARGRGAKPLGDAGWAGPPKADEPAGA